MDKLQIKTNPRVELVFANYPDAVRNKMQDLRALVIETAKESDEITALEETLKWDEPSFLTKHGSTLRMDWKARTPDQYALYFQCSSRLVETFRLLFRNDLTFEGNRAIVFQITDELPKEILKLCIRATLTYHKVKNMPTLGI